MQPMSSPTETGLHKEGNPSKGQEEPAQGE